MHSLSDLLCGIGFTTLVMAALAFLAHFVWRGGWWRWQAVDRMAAGIYSRALLVGFILFSASVAMSF